MPESLLRLGLKIRLKNYWLLLRLIRVNARHLTESWLVIFPVLTQYVEIFSAGLLKALVLGVNCEHHKILCEYNFGISYISCMLIKLVRIHEETNIG